VDGDKEVSDDACTSSASAGNNEKWSLFDLRSGLIFGDQSSSTMFILNLVTILTALVTCTAVSFHAAGMLFKVSGDYHYKVVFVE